VHDFTVEFMQQSFQGIVSPTALLAVFERLTQGGPFGLMLFQKRQSGLLVGQFYITGDISQQRTSCFRVIFGNEFKDVA